MRSFDGADEVEDTRLSVHRVEVVDDGSDKGSGGLMSDGGRIGSGAVGGSDNDGGLLRLLGRSGVCMTSDPKGRIKEEERHTFSGDRFRLLQESESSPFGEIGLLGIQSSRSHLDLPSNSLTFPELRYFSN